MNVTNIPKVEQPESSFEPLQESFILTQLEKNIFLFPAKTVGEILPINRMQIMALPFYDPAILGIVHNNGQFLPLVSLRQVLNIPGALANETLTVICLNKTIDRLSGLGIVVDSLLGMRKQSELPEEIFVKSEESSEPSSDTSDLKMKLFRVDLLENRLWQPQRWQAIDL